MTLKINLVLLSIFKNNVQVPFIYDFRKLFNKMFFLYTVQTKRRNRDAAKQFGSGPAIHCQTGMAE